VNTANGFGSGQTPASSGRQYATPFVGRETEIEKLTALLGRAGAGASQTVFIAGEPGAGKTRLAQEFANQACDAGWQVLIGRAYDMLSMPPFVAFIEPLRHYILSCPTGRLRKELAECAAEVAILIHEVRTRFPRLEAGPPLSPELEQYRMFNGMSDFLTRIAEGSPPGLIIIIDEMHWADASTLS
jgi:predicted ATPase